MATIKMLISKVKLPFYPPCEVKCGLQNRVSTTCGFVLQVGVDLVEESMQMIGGLQLVACTQSSQYVLNKMNWVKDDASLMLFT